MTPYTVDRHVHCARPARGDKHGGGNFLCTKDRPFDPERAGEKALFTVIHDARSIDGLLVCRHCHIDFPAKEEVA